MRVDESVLILGGSGLAGEPTARAFLAAGARVTVVTRGHRAGPAGAEVLVADRGDPVRLAQALGGRRFDRTIDFLAYDEDDVARLFAVPDLDLGRVIAISTGQVYLVTRDPRPPFREGDSARPVIDEPEPGTRAHANWAYGMGKRRMEAALGALGRERGASAALRVPILIGAGDQTGRFWAYVERLLDGGPLLIPGSLEQPLRFLWVEDLARLLVTLAAGGRELGGALNFAQPDVLTVQSFIAHLAGALGVAVPPLLICSPGDLAQAGLDDDVSPYVSRWCSVLDPSLARTAFGVTATPFPEALPRVLAGLRARAPASDVGYARRALELSLAARLAG